MIFLTTLLMGSPDGGFSPSSFLFIGLIFIIFYFFIIRPQSKKAKEQKNFMAELKKGDKIVTTGGIFGRVAKVDDDSLMVEVDNNTKLRIAKSAISVEMSKAINQPAEEKK